MSPSLTPAHALLTVGLKTRPVEEALQAVEAWLSLDLLQPGRQADGETDLTVFLKHLPAMVDLMQGKDDRSAWIVTQLERMTQHTSLFEANAEGVTGWDLLQARESLSLTRWWLDRPDRPALDTLMQRVPQGEVPAANGMKVPTVWAAWALQDRGDELKTVMEAGEPHGLAWPATVLGWAHPRLVKDLLDWGAPWQDQVKTLWADRQRQGQLTQKSVATMQLQCAVTLDRDLSQLQSAAWRKGADVVKSLKESKDPDNCLDLLADAGSLVAFTAPYTVATPQGNKRQDVPLVVRLLAMGVSEELAQGKVPGFLCFLNKGWDALAGDPEQPVLGSAHTLGTLAHTVAFYQAGAYAGWERSKQTAATQALSGWKRTIEAWAGPMNWDAVVACADDLDSHGPGWLFSNASPQESFQRSVNAHGVSQALKELNQMRDLSPEKAHAPAYRVGLRWTHWVMARAQTPGQNRGLLTTPSSHRGFDTLLDPSTNVYTRADIAPLFQVMTTEEKLTMMTAFLLGRPDESAFGGAKRLKGALYAQAGWERADAAARRTLTPWLERLAQGEGKGWSEVIERAAQTLGAWTADARQTQAQAAAPTSDRRRARRRS